MSRTKSVQDSVVVEGISPEDVYDEISDVTQMGRWSPENLGADVSAARESAYVGMVFVGANKRGGIRWRTRCTVTAADRGERFAFRVHGYSLRGPLLPVKVASWEYRFEAVEGGTRVTEIWTDDRRGWPDALAARFDRAATGGKLFSEFQQRNIQRTLAKVKSELESTPES